MRILVVGKFYREAFAAHIAETLEDMGHNVFLYEPGVKYQQAESILEFRYYQFKRVFHEVYKHSSIYKKNEDRKLFSSSGSDKIDLIISCHDFLTPKQIRQLKEKYNCIACLWFPDAISNFGKAMFLDAEYDFLFFKEPFAVNVLRNEYNKNAYYLPECCNPKYHNHVDLTKADRETYSCQLTTAGNMHTARSAMFKSLVEYDVKIWGNPAPLWMDTTGIQHMIQNKFVSNEEKAKSFLAADIVINSVHPTEILGTNVRTFEIAACKAFQLVNDRPGIHYLYKLNEEIITFSDIADLRKKIDYYLINKNEKLEIAAKAYERTHKEHTYAKRLQLMFSTIEGKEKGFKPCSF